MLFNLHLLRALAALAVVYFHITSVAGLNLDFNIGAHGVDVFFVISGFIIAHIGSRTPEHFLIRRLIRIVPFYWSASLLVFGVAVMFPHLLRSTQPDPIQLLCSLLFIPRETAYAGMFPTLILGWSLNYEMYFYVVFSLSLALSGRRAPLLCAVLIALVAAAIGLSGVDQPSIMFYARPLVLEFCFGIACFYALRLAERHAGGLRSVPYARALLLILAVLAALTLGLEEYHGGHGLPRFIGAGLPAAVLVFALLMLERIFGVSAKSRLVYHLGESSYVLYLIHPYIIYAILRLLIHNPDALGAFEVMSVIVVLLAVSAATAVALHVYFEKPLMERLRRRLVG